MTLREEEKYVVCEEGEQQVCEVFASCKEEEEEEEEVLVNNEK